MRTALHHRLQYTHCLALGKFIITISLMHEFNISQIDLNLVVVMAVLLRERSVTRAARSLGRSQSAVSHALNRLRVLLRDPLFVRSPGGIAPTTAALALEPAITAILDNAQSFFGDRHRFDLRRDKRVFNVGLSDYTSFLSLPKMVAELDRDAPGVEMNVRNTSHSLGYGMLESGEVELIVGNFPPAPQYIREQVLFTEEYVCAMRKSHPAAGRKMTLELYEASKHLVVSLQGNRNGYLDTAIRKLGLTRTVQVVTGHFVPVPFILLENDSIATEPSRMILPLAKVLGLSVCKPPFKIDPMPIKMAWHRRYDNDAGHAWLRSLFTRHAK